MAGIARSRVSIDPVILKRHELKTPDTAPSLLLMLRKESQTLTPVLLAPHASSNGCEGLFSFCKDDAAVPICKIGACNGDGGTGEVTY